MLKKHELITLTLYVPKAGSLQYSSRYISRSLARSRLKWAGHVEEMGDEKLAKRANTQKMEGKHGRRMENNYKRYRSWRLIIGNAVRKQSDEWKEKTKKR